MSEPDSKRAASDVIAAGSSEPAIERYNLTAVRPGEDVGGPFAKPAGAQGFPDVDTDIDRLHPDAGVAWWLRLRAGEV